MTKIKKVEYDNQMAPILTLDDGQKLKCKYNDGGESLKSTTRYQLENLIGHEYKSIDTLKWYLTTGASIVKEVELITPEQRFGMDNLNKLKNKLSEDMYKKVITWCLILYTNVFSNKEVDLASRGKFINNKKVIDNENKVADMNYIDVKNLVNLICHRNLDTLLESKELDYESKYSQIIDKLYDEGIIIDMDNIDDDLKEDILVNGYEDDFKITNWDEEDVMIYQIPFVYGFPDVRVTYNYICFYKNRCKCFEMDYDVYDLLSNEDCLPLNYKKIKEKMFEMGIA